MMRVPVLAALALAAVGCSVTPYGGIAMHTEGHDRPEVELKNPIGIIGVQRRWPGGHAAYCAHRSSIPEIEDGSGLNECGYRQYFD